MAQSDGLGGFYFSGNLDEPDYEFSGEPGERKAYATYYAGARAGAGDPDSEYMKNIAKGAMIYDNAVMKQNADSLTAKYYRQEHPDDFSQKPVGKKMVKNQPKTVQVKTSVKTKPAPRKR